MPDNLDRLLSSVGLPSSISGPDAAASDQSLAPRDDLDRLLGHLDITHESLVGNDPEPIPRAQPPATQPPIGGAPLKDDGNTGAFALGAGDTATFGLLDEAGGVADTLLGSFAGDGQRENVWTSKRGFSDILSSNIAKNRAIMENAHKEHGWAYFGGQAVGGLTVPFGAGAKGAAEVAKVGAAQGAAYGLGSGTDLQDRATKALEFGAGGAALGGIIGKVTELAAPVVNRLLGREAKGTPVNPAEEAPVGQTVEGDVAGKVEGWTDPDINGNRQPLVSAPESAPTGIPEETIPLHSEPTLEDPTGAPAGSISRAGLEDLQAKVQGFRDRVEATNGRAVDVPAQDPVGAFRLGNLGDGPDTMSLLGALARQLPPKTVKSDASLMASAQAAAIDMGTGDPEAIHALASQIAGPLGDADAAIATLRTVQRQAADQVDLFHGAGIDWSTASDEAVQAAGQAIYNVQQLNSLVQTAKVGVGRALRVFSLPNSEEYFQALAKGETLTPPVGPRNIPALPGTRDEMKDFFELWGMTKGSPKAQSDLLQGTLTVPTAGKYLANSMANLFTASILSAPKTVMLNLVGPAFINTLRSLERMGGGALGAIDPFASAAERAAQAEVAKQTPLALFHTIGDVRDAFRYGVQAFKENHTVLGGGGTVRDANISFGPYNENLLKAAGVDPNMAYTLGNVINIFPKAFARVNAGLDEAAKRLTYLNEVRLRAQVEAAGQGLEGDEAHAFVTQALSNSTDEAGASTDEGILRSAERTTLTGQVGAEDTFARNTASYIQSLRHDYPLMRFVLPVFNVPANALGETLRRIPGLERLPGFSEHAADLAGDNGPVAQAEAHGRALLGGSFLTAGYLMNQAGLLTGAGPQNGTDAKVWRQTHEPYSVRIGDTWVSYRKLDILGGLLSIPATVSDVTVYHKADDQDHANMALMATAALAQWFKDQASLQTAMRFLELGDNPTADPQKQLEPMMGKMVAGLIPGSALIRTLGVDAIDPYVRMKRSWSDYIKAGIPGLSEELEPLRNVLGEPINRPANSLAEAVFPVTMAPVATWKKEPVLDELTRLYRHTGYSAGSDPKSLGYGHFHPEDVKLEDGRSLYFHAMQARATMEIDGQTLKQSLGELIMSGRYREAVDADAGEAVTSRGDESRGYLVRSVFDTYNKAIKAEVAAASPIALKYLTAAAAKQRDDAYLRAVPVEDLVKNPDLYRTNGVDPEAYSSKITEGAVGTLIGALGGKDPN